MIGVYLSAIGLAVFVICLLFVLLFFVLVNIHDALDILSKMASAFLSLVTTPKSQSQSLNLAADVLLVLIILFAIPQIFGRENPIYSFISIMFGGMGILVCVYWTIRK